MPKNQNLGDLRGVLAAVVTPVDPNGDPDTTRFVQHARWALDNGCDGLNVLGTTGEANSFSAAQRLTVMQAASAELDPSRFMVGTGTPDARTTIELTNAADSLGFAGALILPPYYYKGVSDQGLFEWFAGVVEDSDPIPIYIYNFPQMTGLPISVELMSRLATTFPDRIAGAKDSSGDLEYASEIAKIRGLSIFPSDESSLARAKQEKYAGCISATANITAPIAAKLWTDQGNGELAETVNAARMKIASQPLIAAVKHLVARCHDDTSFERLLPPHLELDEAQKAALADFALQGD